MDEISTGKARSPEPVRFWPEDAVHIIDTRWQPCTMKASVAAACRGSRGRILEETRIRGFSSSRIEEALGSRTLEPKSFRAPIRFGL